MNVFFSDLFMPKRFAGYTVGPLIFIRPSHRDDVGLLAHERVHVRQWLRSLGLLHSLRYLLSDSYKLACEVEAYQAQAACYPDDRLPLFAGYIAKDYSLSITQADALKLLRKI